MEVIRLSGYTEIEKLEMARRFLVEKQTVAAGLRTRKEFPDEGISSLIQYYTREAGPNLEREIGNVARKIARKTVDKEIKEKTVINAQKVTEGNWVRRASAMPRPSARTKSVGDKLRVDGSGRSDSHYRVHSDGRQRQADCYQKLGNVRGGRRSVIFGRGGISWVCRRDFYRNLDVHLHIPEGAIPRRSMRWDHAGHHNL